MSFGPFLGGKRICLGKAFAETMITIFSTIMLMSFNFELEDKTMTKRPANNFFVIHEPTVLVKISKV